jgi:hypothetical protein
VVLKNPVPVFIGYLTAKVDWQGKQISGRYHKRDQALGKCFFNNAKGKASIVYRLSCMVYRPTITVHRHRQPSTVNGQRSTATTVIPQPACPQPLFQP